MGNLLMSEWREHDGGECPVPADAIVQVILRWQEPEAGRLKRLADRRVVDGLTAPRAGTYYWHHAPGWETGGDVVMYRVRLADLD